MGSGGGNICPGWYEVERVGEVFQGEDLCGKIFRDGFEEVKLVREFAMSKFDGVHNWRK